MQAKQRAEQAYAGTDGAFDPTKEPPGIDEWMRSWGFSHGEEMRGQYKEMVLKWGSGGLTGVWAEENTREAIFAALQRKESFATSGTRIKLRMFGGWSFAKDSLKRREWIDAAYRGGVPMGGDLPLRPSRGVAPSLILWAAKDPGGANLERLQVIKVSTTNGERTEQVFEVAVSKGGSLGLRRHGAVELSGVWRDPSFDPLAPALYYMRVIEVPTRRWSTIVVARAVKEPPAGVPTMIQERGWSSPIWYSPSPR